MAKDAADGDRKSSHGQLHLAFRILSRDLSCRCMAMMELTSEAIKESHDMQQTTFKTIKVLKDAHIEMAKAEGRELLHAVLDTHRHRETLQDMGFEVVEMLDPDDPEAPNE